MGPPVIEEVEAGVLEESRPTPPPVTVVVSLKTESEILGSRLQPEDLGQRMMSQLPTVEGVVVLLNAPTEYIQAQLGSVASVGGAAVLLDLRVTGPDNAVSGNIYRNFVPLEQLEGEEYDETLLILLAINKEVEQAIEAAFLQEVEASDLTADAPLLEDVGQGGELEEARVTEFLEDEDEFLEDENEFLDDEDEFLEDEDEFLEDEDEYLEEEEVNDEDEQLFDPTASQDYSFEAGRSQDYDVVGGSDQDYSLRVADGQDYSLGAGGSINSQDYSLSDAGSSVSSQDYSVESEDPSSSLTSSFLLEDTNRDSEDGLLTSDYFGDWDEYPSEDPAAPAVQVDQVVQLRVPEAVRNIEEVAVEEEEEGGVPVPEPEADHVAVDGEQGIARPDFDDPPILVGSPVTPAQDLGQIQEVATSY